MQQAPAGGKFCHGCGNSMAPDARFCNKCGAQL
ncbi:MAG: zinc-ribbon domain-containing protein [Nitrososphaerales archaeon]